MFSIQCGVAGLVGGMQGSIMTHRDVDLFEGAMCGCSWCKVGGPFDVNTMWS